jgi:hypothetical protein
VSLEEAIAARQQIVGTEQETDQETEPVAAVLWRGEEPLYRLISRMPPRARDFWSQAEKRKPRVRPTTPTILHVGVSVWAIPGAAVARALRRPTFLAEVRLPEGQGIHIAKTYGPHHFTVWGDPDVLAQLVQGVEEIPR